MKIQWCNENLINIKTGREIAFRYCINDEVRVFVHRKWRKNQNEIRNDSRTKAITSDRDFVGSISDEWPDILSDLKSLTGDVLLVSSDVNEDSQVVSCREE